MKEILIHPFCYLLPWMTDEEFKALKEDIKKHGLIEPITLYEGQILDGKCRYKACKELKITPKFVEFHGDDLEALIYVIRKNILRQQLNKDQISCIIAEAVTEAEKFIKNNILYLNKKMNKCLLKSKNFENQTEVENFLSTHPECFSCQPYITEFMKENIDRYSEIVQKYNYCLWCMLKGEYNNVRKRGLIEALDLCKSCERFHKHEIVHAQYIQKTIQFTLF